MSDIDVDEAEAFDSDETIEDESSEAFDSDEMIEPEKTSKSKEELLANLKIAGVSLIEDQNEENIETSETS